MKVTVWGINYAPEVTGIAPFNRALCEFLAARGHAVEMVTAFPYYPEWKKRVADRGQWFRSETQDGVRIHRCWLYVPRKVAALERMLHEASFVVLSLLRVLASRRPDVFVVISPPLLLGAAAWVAGLIKRAPFVFHVQDLQPDAAVGLGMLRQGWVTWALFGLEAFAYSRAARISGISPGMLAKVREKGVAKERLIYFPNGVEQVATPPPRGRFRARHGIAPETFVALYSGNFGVKQGLGVLVEAARLLVEEKGIQVVIAGDGAQRGELAQSIAEAGLKNILLLPLQPEGEYREMLADADCCLITQQHGTGAFFFPSKLLAALAHGKAVVTVADENSELTRASREGGFGPNVAPEDPHALADAVRMLARAGEETRRMGESGRKFVEQFEMGKVLADFEARLFETLRKIPETGGDSAMAGGWWCRILRVLVFLSAFLFAASAEAQVPVAGPPTVLPTRVIAKPKGAVKPAELLAATRNLGATIERNLQRVGGVRVLKIQDGEGVPAKIAKLRRTGLFEYVEPDYVVTIRRTPNDPRFLDGSQWALQNTGQSGGSDDADLDASEAWEVQTSAPGVIVAVIDTGARLTHEDLAANLWTNAAEIPGDGIDNDQDGYIDDVHGINAIHGTGDPSDDNGHGTHVSGTIGAIGNNGVGIAGVAWGVQIMPLKFLGANGSGSISDAITCINYAIAKGANILSNSWGGGGYSQALRDAIAAARDAGMIFVVAAGNDARDNDFAADYPSDYEVDNVVSVAATTRNDALSSFSNFGFGFVNVAAPGSDILSTWNTADNSYNSISGTSMATPHVSGVLAMLKARFPADSHAQLINRLERSVDHLASLEGRCHGGGRVNLQRALSGSRNAPFNDDFAESSPFTSETLHLRTQNLGATAEPGEPMHAGQNGGTSVWWTWTPPVSGSTVLSTARSSFETLLAVYTGSRLDALTAVASDDGGGGAGGASRVRFDAVAGTAYHIAVVGKEGSTGTIILTLGKPPQNDDFADAITITGLSAQRSGVSGLASREVGEPLHAGQPGGASLWWKWVAPVSGKFAVDTSGSDFDTLLGVYTGSSVGSLAEVASNDNEAARTTSRAIFTATAGTTYYFAVDGANGAVGAVALSLAVPPPNDFFADRFTVSGPDFATNGTNVGASSEIGEPEHAGLSAGRSIWWKWTAPTTQAYAFTTAGSSFDTLLAVYTGSAVEALTTIAENDDAGLDLSSAVRFEAIAGVTYQIAVDGFAGETGAVVLNAHRIMPPPNDDFASRVLLSGTSTGDSGTNRFATQRARGAAARPVRRWTIRLVDVAGSSHRAV